MRIAPRVSSAAITSPEDSTPAETNARLPVARPVPSLSATSTNAAASDAIAVRCGPGIASARAVVCRSMPSIIDGRSRSRCPPRPLRRACAASLLGGVLVLDLGEVQRDALGRLAAGAVALLVGGDENVVELDRQIRLAAGLPDDQCGLFDVLSRRTGLKELRRRLVDDLRDPQIADALAAAPRAGALTRALRADAPREHVERHRAPARAERQRPDRVPAGVALQRGQGRVLDRPGPIDARDRERLAVDRQRLTLGTGGTGCAGRTCRALWARRVPADRLLGRAAGSRGAGLRRLRVRVDDPDVRLGYRNAADLLNARVDHITGVRRNRTTAHPDRTRTR